jgi:hypothetical protein
MGMSNRKYTNEFGEIRNAEEYNKLELTLNCLAIETFVEKLAYHRSANIRKQMNENVRALFYDLAIEDFLRMGFLKGIILQMAHLDMAATSDEDYTVKFDRLTAKFIKVWMLNTYAFSKFSFENTYLYSKPCAEDILDTRLIKVFIQKCVPLIEELTPLFTDTREVEFLH